ncbi:DUF2335 domain-containing protein [candidate division WOR-3 bacterium]|nr:DUF2335 domain-containing protein [candidate division WOR-3 bacterium]
MKKDNKEEEIVNNNRNNNVPCEDKDVEELEHEIKEKIPDLPKKKRKEVAKIATLFALKRFFFSGPLPPPELFKKYEEILPGSAERILKMAENQSTHRQELEKRVVFSSTRNETLGVIFAFIIFMIAVGLGTLLIYNNKDVEGLVTIVFTVLGGIGVFIYGKKRQREELKSKRESIDNHRS